MSIGLGKLVIKLVQTQDNVVRRIRVDRTTFTFADLEASASVDTCTCLSYLDDEHETITLACEDVKKISLKPRAVQVVFFGC